MLVFSLTREQEFRSELHVEKVPATLAVQGCGTALTLRDRRWS
jgi:hypothetical protein